MSVDFSQLAPPDIIETIDYEVILAERKADLIDFQMIKTTDY